jgi:hypothetical protein
MQTLTIEAVTRESARDLQAALSAFRARLSEGDDGPCRVEVTLGRGGREIVDLLNAIEHYVTEHRAGATQIRLNDHSYTLHEARLGLDTGPTGSR